MIFKRDTLKNKENYYLILIVVEIILYIGLFFTSIHWFFLILIFPFLAIEIISNKRCSKRQKNFIKEIEFNDEELICTHKSGNKTEIDYNKLLFSFREIKFEKDKSEIEIKKKGKIRNKLIGRLHIKEWKAIFDIKNEFLTKEITRVKFRPEGYWSKYAGITADIVITGSALAAGELSDLAGNSQNASELRNVAFQVDLNSLHKEHKNGASN